MRYYRPLFQGEGISGPSDVGAETGALYSCIGIALVNRDQQRGGLYHYPCGLIGNANVMRTIRAMVDDIQPDEIVMTPAAVPTGVIGTLRTDIEKVREALQDLSPGTPIGDPAVPAVLARYYWVDGSPVFNATSSDIEALDAVEEEPSQALRRVMYAGPRSLGGGVRYFGGDGENSNALEQGLGGSTTAPVLPSRSGRSRGKSLKKSIKKRCIIM